MTHYLKALSAVCTIMLLAGCAPRATAPQQPTEYVAAPTSYADTAMWYITLGDTTGQGADVFYIPSTWEFDWYTTDSIVSHYADTSNPQHRADMRREMSKTARYMADGNNYYSPYYRHITLDSWATLNEDTIARRYHDVAFVDVCNAFNYFLTHYNQERPFIVAGFSQGGKSVVELLKIMSPEVRSRMIAAYVLGFKVTPDDVAQAPWIIGAQDSVDTGVTICYNSVSDVQYTKPVVSEPNVMSINPVNWRTDETPATLQDTITVTLNVEHKVLVVEGYDGSHLPRILDMLNTGDYHGIEPWVYSECLRENFKQRTRAFREGQK